MQEEVPYVDDNGADGSQVVGSDSFSNLPISTHTRGLPADVIGFFADDNPKEFGKSPLGVRIIASLLDEKIINLKDAQAKIFELEEELSTAKENLAASRSRTAILTERLGSTNKLDIIFQAINVFAAVLLGIAVDLYKSGSPSTTTLLLGGIGALLLLLPFIGMYLRHAKD